MKQIVLAVMAFFLVISMYVVFTSLKDTGIFDKQNLSTTTKISDNNATENQAVKTKTTAKKSRVKPYPITPKSKRIFLEQTTAAVTKVKKRLDAQYQMVYELSRKESLTAQEQATLTRLKKRYKVKGIPCLLKRLRTHPVSIVLAQAALETGWGSSRFYREANNIFGIWSFNKNEPRIAAGVQRDGKKTIYVKKYPNLEASIEGYYRMVAKGRSYGKFRDARLRTDNPFELIPFLDHYSELRHEYVKRLYYVIKSNKFYELDDPQFQPPGWTNIKPADPKYLQVKEDKTAAKIADKCTKDNNDSIEEVPGAEDENSSHAIDISALPKESTETAQSNDVPPTHEDIEDMNKSKEQNRTIDTPIEIEDVNITALTKSN